MRRFKAEVAGLKIESVQEDRLDVLVRVAKQYEGYPPRAIVRRLLIAELPPLKNPPPCMSSCCNHGHSNTRTTE